MKSITTKIKSIRFLLAMFLGMIVLFNNPVIAIASPFNSGDGTVQLNKIQDKAEKVLENPATTLEQVERRTNGGLNEIQGKADKNKMNNTKDSKPAVVKQLEKVLEKVNK